MRPCSARRSVRALRRSPVSLRTTAAALVVAAMIALFSVAPPPTAAPAPAPSFEASASGVQAAASSSPSPWRLIFADEFDRPSIDTAKWSTGWFGSGVTGPVGAGEQACYDPAQVRLTSAQSLSISLIRKTQQCAGRQRPWTTGLLTTNGKFNFTYGIAEARIYLPTGSAGKPVNWPAFWTTGQNWPHDGENDIMEGLGGAVGPHFHSTRGGPGFTVPGSWGGWHTFDSLWQPGSVTYYYDGKRVGSITEGITGKPMYLILGFGPSDSSPTVPATMLVDYVRVWQR